MFSPKTRNLTIIWKQLTPPHKYWLSHMILCFSTPFQYTCLSLFSLWNSEIYVRALMWKYLNWPLRLLYFYSGYLGFGNGILHLHGVQPSSLCPLWGIGVKNILSLSMTLSSFPSWLQLIDQQQNTNISMFPVHIFLLAINMLNILEKI